VKAQHTAENLASQKIFFSLETQHNKALAAAKEQS
jgi:hypothetical protein